MPRAVPIATAAVTVAALTALFALSPPAPPPQHRTPPTRLTASHGPKPGATLDGINGAAIAIRTMHQLAWYAGARQVAEDRARTAAQAAARARTVTVRSSGSTITPAPRAPSSSGCAYADLIRSVWTRDAEWAIGIAMRESHCQAGARNASGASGLYQLMLPMHGDLFRAVGCDPSQWADPACNVRAAWQLYQGSGRRPWSM